MKPILNREIVLEWVREQRGKIPDGETTVEMANGIGKMEILSELLDLTERHI